MPVWFTSIIGILYGLTVLGVISVVILENRNPVKSLAWLTVLFLLPGLGIVLYFVFGRNLRNTRMISRHNKRRLRRRETFRRVKLDKLGLSEQNLQHINLCRALSGAVAYPANEVRVFTNGHDKFKALLDDISKATKYINIQYYIFADDRLGNKVKDALIERAKAGVAVRVIYDHVGSYGTKKRFFNEMREAGAEAYPFFKVAFPFFGTRINWRNHRKLCVIDGSVGYIGGMNVASRYIDGGDSFDCWRDTHMRIKGPAVAGLQYSFAVDWNFMGRPLLDDEIAYDCGEEHDTEGHVMQVLSSGPTSQWANQAFMFLKAIGNARKRIFIQTPYFLPTNGLLTALQSASLSGVDVRVMVPRRSDSKMLMYASNSYITECLQAGIKIYMYEAGMLHAKTLLIDDDFSSVGSTNFDFRSFEHNFEANVNVYSRSFARRMLEIFQKDMRVSTRVEAAQWRRRPLRHRLAESIMRLLSPIL